MSNASTFLTMLKNNLEVELIPVLIGSLQVYEKSPNAGGILAAEAYFLGNAPAALLSGETSLLQTGITDLQAALAKAEAAAATPATPPAA
jgi:hypothetical protein